jgi:hypothetical protein
MTVAGYPTESKWTVLEGTQAGKPMYVRRNESVNALQESGQFPFRLGVAVQFARPASADGLPDHEEMEALGILEDALCEALEADQVALEVLAITTGGMREFVFYARDRTVVERITGLKPRFPQYRLTSYVADDPAWGLYAEFR